MNLKYKIKIKSLHKESIKLYINFLDTILKKNSSRIQYNKSSKKKKQDYFIKVTSRK